MATIFTNQLLPVTNVRLDDTNGNTTIVGGAGALSTDDGYGTYVDRTWDDFETANGMWNLNSAMARVDVAPLTPPAGATNIQITHVDVIFRGYRVDDHGQHEFGRLWFKPDPVAAGLGDDQSTILADGTFKLPQSTASPAYTRRILAPSTVTVQEWLTGLTNLPVQIRFAYNVNNTRHSPPYTSAPCRVQMTYLALQPLFSYDVADTGREITMGATAPAAVASADTEFSPYAGALVASRRMFESK